jgi:hypothetical protein
MAQLNIYVKNTNNRTTSQFGITGNGKIVFHNMDTRVLHVVIESESEEYPILEAGKPVSYFTVQPRGKQAFTVGNLKGSTFKYTAKLELADPEDPIIIIE